MKSKALAISQKNPLHVITPPPTKAEVLEAMVQVRAAQRRKEMAEIKAEKERLTAEVEEMLAAFLRKNIGKIAADFSLGNRRRKLVDDRYVYTDELTTTCAHLDLPELPRSIAAKVLKIDDLDRKRVVTDPDMIRKEVRGSFRGKTQDRVCALLENAEARAALEGALEKMAP